MSIEEAAHTVRRSDSEPTPDAIDRILEVARSFDGLMSLTTALGESPRPWSARLITLAAIRMARADSATTVQLSPMAFDLLKIVGRIDDWPASAGCLDLVKLLVEDQGLEPRDGADRLSLLDLLWRSLAAEHPNARSAAVHTLEAIYDFGDLARLLGDDGVREMRHRVHKARSEAGGALAEDLASAERLLP
ncbi:MAG: hypothetical protein ACRD2W_06055 [Acidimicrobiales bacterium]